MQIHCSSKRQLSIIEILIIGGFRSFMCCQSIDNPVRHLAQKESALLVPHKRRTEHYRVPNNRSLAWSLNIYLGNDQSICPDLLVKNKKEFVCFQGRKCIFRANIDIDNDWSDQADFWLGFLKNREHLILKISDR